MRKRFTLLLVLVLASVTLAGCIGNGTSPEEVRDGFVEGVENISSYEHEGELTRQLSPVNQMGVQVSTTTTEATLDYEERELRSVLESARQGNGTIRSNTTTYLVNGTVYERTESVLGTNWTRFNNSREVERTWEARDELGLYAEVLRNASVTFAEEEQGANDGTHALNVELDSDERIDFLMGKLGDQQSFFDDVEVRNFSMTVWISEDESRLVRAETDVSLTVFGQQTQVGEVDFEVRLEAVDEFSDYNEPVEIELPEGARNAETLLPEGGG